MYLENIRKSNLFKKVCQQSTLKSLDPATERSYEVARNHHHETIEILIKFILETFKTYQVYNSSTKKKQSK